MASPTVFTSYEQVLTTYFPKRAASLLNSDSEDSLFESTLAKDVMDHLKKELQAPSKKKTQVVKAAKKAKR